MAYDEEEAEDDELQTMLKELYHESIKIAKNNKELKELAKILCSQSEELENKVVRLEQECKDLTLINNKLELVVKEDNRLHKIFGGQKKLLSTSMK